MRELRLYKYRGEVTVVWRSESSGRKLTPQTRNRHAQTRAYDADTAATDIVSQIERTITTSQKRDITITGTLTEIGHKLNRPAGHPAEILSVCRIETKIDGVTP